MLDSRERAENLQSRRAEKAAGSLFSPSFFSFFTQSSLHVWTTEFNSMKAFDEGLFKSVCHYAHFYHSLHFVALYEGRLLTLLWSVAFQSSYKHSALCKLFAFKQNVKQTSLCCCFFSSFTPWAPNRSIETVNCHTWRWIMDTLTDKTWIIFDSEGLNDFSSSHLLVLLFFLLQDSNAFFIRSILTHFTLLRHSSNAASLLSGAQREDEHTTSSTADSRAAICSSMA